MKATKNFKRLNIISIFVMLLISIAGVLLFKFDKLDVNLGKNVIAAIFAFEGLFSLIKYLYDGFNNKVYTMQIVSSVVSIIMAIICLIISNPVKSVGIVFGIWIIIKGLFNFGYAIKFIKAKEEIYPLVTFISLLYVTMGILCFINPFDVFMSTNKLVALFVAVFGVLEILLSLLFRQRAKQVLKIYS